MKTLMVGIGCPEAQTDDVGGLQSVFDLEQAKNIASYVHEGSVAFILSIHFYRILTVKWAVYLIICVISLTVYYILKLIVGMFTVFEFKFAIQPVFQGLFMLIFFACIVLILA